jgi:site-specific DNA-methyltransferase (adenine-specific)
MHLATPLPAAYWAPLSMLRKWAKNPRKNNEAVPCVARSIRKYGFVAPVVVWQSRNRLVAGHTRIIALESILQREPAFVPRDAPGPGLVPVRFHEFTDEAEANAYAIADNKLAEAANWDEQLLGTVLEEIRTFDQRLLADTGFVEDEIERLIREAQHAPADGDAPAEPEALPPPPEPSDTLLAKWGVEPGQLWVIPGTRGTTHRLLCGDCRRPEDVVRVLDGRKINVAFTSPPYAAQREYDESSGFKPIAPDAYTAWFEPVQTNVRTHLAPEGSWFVNIKEHCEDGQRVLYVKDLALAHVRRWGWLFVDELCWVRKGVPGGWPNRFKTGWEPVFHFSRERAIKFRPETVSHRTEHAFDYSPQTARSRSGSGLLGTDPHGGYREGLARPTNVIEVNARPGDYDPAHPAQFPIGLPEFFLRAYSDPSDVVLDPFVGAGTTLLAAEQTGRAGHGIEIAPRYCAVVLERLAALGLTPALEGRR